MIDKIKDWFKVYSRKTEEQTERDGFLSYAGEFHSLALGLGVGLMAGARGSPEIMSAFIAVTLGIGAAGEGRRVIKKALKKIGKEDEDATAIGEIKREPWYALGGAMISFVVVGAIAHGPSAVSEMVESVKLLGIF